MLSIDPAVRADIFRPYKGYQEVRLIDGKSTVVSSSGLPPKLVFVEFDTSAHAFAALLAAQEYPLDLKKPEGDRLRIKFARNKRR